MKINLILAKSINGVIGKDNKIPWHLPEDMARFKRLTDGQVVIMGRKTWESLPEKFRPLPNRVNIVVSKNKDYKCPGAILCQSISNALIMGSQAIDKEIWIIGGSTIYNHLEPIADRMEVTVIDQVYEGDAYAPAISSEWKTVSKRSYVSKNGLQYSFQSFTRDNSLT